MAVSGQAASSEPRRLTIRAASLCHTLRLRTTLTGLRAAADWDSFSCSLQPAARRALLSHSRGRDNCFDSSLQQRQRGELYSKGGTAQRAHEGPTNDALPPQTYIRTCVRARESPSTPTPPARINALLWPRVFLWESMLIRWSLTLEYYFCSSVRAIVSTTSLSASIPRGPAAGLNAVSFPSDWPWL